MNALSSRTLTGTIRRFKQLANDYAQNLNVRRITHLPHIVRKTRISGKTKIVSDGYLPVERPVI